jgi:hypothetical protein
MRLTGGRMEYLVDFFDFANGAYQHGDSDAPPGNEIRNRPKQSRQLRPATVGY